MAASVEASADPRRPPEIVSTARWLVAAFGAIAAVTVAGIQLHSIGDVWVARGAKAALGAVGCAVAMLGAVGWLLVLAGRVLTSPVIALRDLSAREVNEGVVGGDLRTKPVKDRALQAVFDQKNDLLGPFSTCMELYKAYQSALSAGAPTADLDRRIERIQTTATKAECEQRYRWLLIGIWTVGAIFVAGLIGFIVLTTARAGDTRVTSPVPVRIFTQPGVQPFGEHCPDVLAASAIGGTYQSPLVSIPKQGGCLAQIRRVTPRMAVVVPEPG